MHDPQAYRAYLEANGAVFRRFGARFLVRGCQNELVEGRGRDRNVVLEFPSYEMALACYRSPEYQAALAHAKGAAERDLVIVEGI